MSDFEVIQELKNKVSALETKANVMKQNEKLLKEFIEDMELENKEVFDKVISKEKYKSLDWSY